MPQRKTPTIHDNPSLSMPMSSLTLLLRHTDGPAATSSGLGVLSTHTEAPVVTQTTMRADLLQSLQIVTEFRVDAVGEDLRVFAVDNVTLPVEEPCGDLVLGGVLDDGDDAFEFFRGEITSAVRFVRCQLRHRDSSFSYRLLRSTSAFLHTKLEYLRPTPLWTVRRGAGAWSGIAERT
jgi:hypothetical protein